MSTIRRPAPLPVLLTAGVLLVITVSAWQTIRFASENDALRSEISERRASATSATVSATLPSSTELERTRAELDRARTRLRTAEAKADELAQTLAIAPADELKSFGRLEELAVDGAKFLKLLEEVPKAKAAADLEGRRWDTAVFLKDLPGWIVHSDAIGQLEENPKEIADVHARALRERLGLDEKVSQHVHARLIAEFALLHQLGFTRPQRPPKEHDEWYAERDRMLLEAAARIEETIPPENRKPSAVVETINLGTGFRNRTIRFAGGVEAGLQLYYQVPGAEPIVF
jgi:hypothetical protein